MTGIKAAAGSGHEDHFERPVLNLLYRYAELMDAGQLEEAAGLFTRAQIRIGGHDGLQDHQALLALWQRMVRIYPCGTPRTRHIINNPILELAVDSGIVECRSVYTVLQATEGFPLQIIANGRYHDRFACHDGQWHFIYRDYTLFDFPGDLSQHLNMG